MYGRAYEKEIKGESGMNIYSFLSIGYDMLDAIWFSEKGINPRDVIENAIADGKYKILDLCCGTFTNGLQIAKKNPQSRIIGIDLSKPMLKEAKRKVRKEKLNNVRLHCMDATATSYPDATFDYIVIGLVLHECTPQLRDSILREAHRLLKKNGKLIILEWEKQSKILRTVKYSPLYFLEVLNSRSFKEFYNCDKEHFFREHGFKIDEIKQCNYSVVMTMKKQG